jgi:hypothetical protein
VYLTIPFDTTVALGCIVALLLLLPPPSTARGLHLAYNKLVQKIIRFERSDADDVQHQVDERVALHV